MKIKIFKIIVLILAIFISQTSVFAQNDEHGMPTGEIKMRDNETYKVYDKYGKPMGEIRRLEGDTYETYDEYGVPTGEIEIQ